MSPYTLLATLGPATANEPAWESLLVAGATGFRVNTSHLALAELDEWLGNLADFRRQYDFRVALDLQGSKWRLGTFQAFRLDLSETIELILAEDVDRPGALPVPHADFFKAAQLSNGEIILNDAKSRLMVESASGEQITARVILPGEISPRKGITFVASEFRVESLSEKDQAILRRTSKIAFVDYAISYVRDAIEMANYRRSCPSQRLIAKLERQPALDESVQIAAYADEIWLCRGDLGAELGVSGMAQAAHRFSKTVKDLPIPVLLAGQVLEHMTEHNAPTRSEMCALYDALCAGYSGVVLSDETAIGSYPLDSVRTAAIFQPVQ